MAFFASFVLGSDLVRQMMRWDMAVLQESPWYQEIEQKGVAKGKFDGEPSLVLRLLSRRVGELSPDTQAQIRSLALPKLEALLDFSSQDDLHHTTWKVRKNTR